MKHNDTQKTINEINSTNSNVTENSMSNDNKKESTNFIECIEKKCSYFSERIKKVFNGFQKNNDNEKELLKKFLKNLLILHPLILSGIVSLNHIGIK